MTRVEFDGGEEAFTGKRRSSVGKRRGSIISSGKGGRVVEGIASSVDIAGMHLVIIAKVVSARILLPKQSDYCQGKIDQPERISLSWQPLH